MKRRSTTIVDPPLDRLIEEVVSAASGGIIYVDKNGTVIKANEEAARIWGVPGESLLGHHNSELESKTIWPDDTSARHERLPVTLALKTGERQVPVTIGIRRPDGNIAWAAIGAVPVCDSKGILCGAFLHIHEVTAPFKHNPLPTFFWKHRGDDFVLIDFNRSGDQLTEGHISAFLGISATKMYWDMPEIVADMHECLRDKALIRRRRAYRFRSLARTTEMFITYAFAPPDLIVIYTEDLSQNLQSEQQLKRLEALLQEAERSRQRELQEQKDAFIRQIIAAQEEERRAIARDLHDGIGQSVISLALRLRLAAQAQGEPEVMAMLSELGHLASGIVEELRRLAAGLHPRILEEIGLTAALGRLVADQSWHGGPQIVLEIVGLDRERLPAPVEVTLYRCVQECLTNIRKHSHATSASVVLQVTDGLINLVVEDNGRGAVLPVSDGFGLASIRERAGLLAGSCDIESSEDSGFAVYVALPRPAATPRDCDSWVPQAKK